MSPKRNAAKCYIMCTFQDVKPTQETAGSWLNRLYNVFVFVMKYTLGSEHRQGRRRLLESGTAIEHRWCSPRADGTRGEREDEGT